MFLDLSESKVDEAARKLAGHYPEQTDEVLQAAVKEWLTTEVREMLADMEYHAAHTGDFALSLERARRDLGVTQ